MRGLKKLGLLVVNYGSIFLSQTQKFIFDRSSFFSECGRYHQNLYCILLYFSLFCSCMSRYLLVPCPMQLIASTLSHCFDVFARLIINKLPTTTLSSVWHCQHKQFLLHRFCEISSLTACLKRGQRKEYSMGLAIDPNSASEIEIIS